MNTEMSEEFEEDPELDDLLERAEKGEAAAMMSLGDICLVENLIGQAQDWFRKAVEAGEPGGYRGLGVIATSLKQDEDALQWWLKGAEAGDQECFYLAGSRMVVNRSVYGRQGFDLLARGFEAGNTACGAELGAAHLLVGEPEEARRWLTAAAAEREPNAARTLAAMTEAAGNTDSALELHRFAADLGVFESLIRADELDHWGTDDPDELFDLASSGDVAAMVTIGRSAIDGGDFQGGVAWLGDAVDQGSASAMTSLGDGFADHSDFDEAEHWYRQAAEHDDRIGTYRLAQLMMNEGRLDEALDLLDPPQNPETLMLVSEIWEMDGDAERAKASLEHLTEMISHIPIPGQLLANDDSHSSDHEPPDS